MGLAMKRGPAIDETQAEARLRLALKRNRALAMGLLGAAAAIFAATMAIHEPGFWVGLARAGAEAALVGGLADWFAVTALFRHPLGLKLPATAVIPRNKDRIGDGLGDFVERNFLAPELLAAKLAELAPVARAARWIADPAHADLLAQRIAETLPPILRSLEDRELRLFVARSFEAQLSEAELAPALGRIVALATRSGPYDALFDRALDAAADLLARHGDRLHALVVERSRWWIPRTFDRRIAEAIFDGISDIIVELRDPASEARHLFRADLERLAEGLVHSLEWRRRVAEFKDRLLAQDEVQAWLGSVWDELRAIVLADLEAPSSRTRAALATGLASLGMTLERDEGMQRRLHEGLEHVALAVVPWRGRISALIAEVVRGWDARTMAARIELAIGSDLQYIRMNGTLVGAAVGCLLYLIARFAVWP
jgi:uncharacterized membrane-anchored protein YjiN (DUF445 family)